MGEKEGKGRAEVWSAHSCVLARHPGNETHHIGLCCIFSERNHFETQNTSGRGRARPPFCNWGCPRDSRCASPPGQGT